MPSTEIDKGELTVYELGYLVLPSIPEDKLSGVEGDIKKVIAKAGGKEIDGETPILHPLAYEMSKTVGASRYVLSDAYLGWIKFEIEPSEILAIRGKIEKMDEILRSLIIKAPRDTYFTFAKARARAKEKEQGEEREEVSKAPEEALLVE